MAYVPPHRRVAGAGAPAPPPAPPAGPVTSAGICIYNHPRQTVLIGVDSTYKRPDNRRDIEILLQVNYRKERGGDFRKVQEFINIFGERGLPNFPNGGYITRDALNANLAGQAGDIPRGVNIRNTALNEIQDVLGISTFEFINRFLLPEAFVNRPNDDQIHLVEHKSSIRFYERVGFAGLFRNGYPHGQVETPIDDNIIPDRPGPQLCNTALREFKEESGFDLARIPGVNLVPVLLAQPVTPHILYNKGIINWANGQYSNGNHIGRQTNAQSQYYFMRIDDAAENSILNAYWGGAPENRAAIVGQGYRYNSELFNLRFINTNNNLIVNGHTAFVTTQLRTANVIPQANFLGGYIYLHKLQKYQNKLNKN